MRRENPSNGGRIIALDGLRGLAIASVFLFHSTAGRHAAWWPARVYSAISRNGWVGVPLFFVLSGFLITGILCNERGRRHSLRNFLVRRTFRIVPLYLACLFFAVAASACVRSLPWALGHLWAPMLFLQDIPGAPTRCLQAFGPLPLFHLWSVAVEQHFYVLWPLLLLRCRDERTAMRMCGWVVAGSSLLRIAGIVHSQLGTALPLVVTHGAELALGAWVALAARVGPLNTLRDRARRVLLAGLGLFMICEIDGGRFEVALAAPAIALVMSALLVLALLEGRVARVLSWAPLQTLGRLSYGIYLFHVPLAPLCERILHAAGVTNEIRMLALRLPLSAIASLGAAALGHRWIEQPAIRLGRRLTTRENRAPLTARQSTTLLLPDYSPSFLTSSL